MIDGVDGEKFEGMYTRGQYGWMCNDVYLIDMADDAIHERLDRYSNEKDREITPSIHD